MSLSGKKIVFSGTMSLKRAEAKSQAESAGAKVLTSVSNTVDILVIGGDIAGKKVADAQAKGVEIWTEADFVKAITAHMFPTASPPAKKKENNSSINWIIIFIFFIK
jgi:DNA ligase (NAD+)